LLFIVGQKRAQKFIVRWRPYQFRVAPRAFENPNPRLSLLDHAQQTHGPSAGRAGRQVNNRHSLPGPYVAVPTLQVRECADEIMHERDRCSKAPYFFQTTARRLAVLAGPSLQRDRIKLRSNSANPPNTLSINRPSGVVVSAHASDSDRKPAFRFDTASSTFRRFSHQQHVSPVQGGYGACQGGPVRLRSALLLAEDFLGTRGSQRRDLCIQRLCICRDACLSVDHWTHPPNSSAWSAAAFSVSNGPVHGSPGFQDGPAQ
jgi:hypothetical protein